MIFNLELKKLAFKHIHLLNSKGISILFLVMAMLLIVMIGYVFSYLIPAKQKSISFVLQSTQAFYIAQSGVEFAVRYAADNGLGSLDGLTRTLGQGSFSLTYNSATDTLISSGAVPTGTERRRIRVSKFSQFLQPAIILDPDSETPCWQTSNQVVVFYIKNISTAPITINAFSASWSQSHNTNLRRIYMLDYFWIIPIWYQRYWGNYQLESPPPIANFTSNQTIDPGEVIPVAIFWQHQRVSGNIEITFYSTTGGSYLISPPLNPDHTCNTIPWGVGYPF